MDCFWNCGVHSRLCSPENDPIPFWEGIIWIHTGCACLEMILKDLDCLFGLITLVMVWWNQLKFGGLVVEGFLQFSQNFIIQNPHLWQCSNLPKKNYVVVTMLLWELVPLCFHWNYTNIIFIWVIANQNIFISWTSSGRKTSHEVFITHSESSLVHEEVHWLIDALCVGVVQNMTLLFHDVIGFWYFEYLVFSACWWCLCLCCCYLLLCFAQ